MYTCYLNGCLLSMYYMSMELYIVTCEFEMCMYIVNWWNGLLYLHMHSAIISLGEISDRAKGTSSGEEALAIISALLNIILWIALVSFPFIQVSADVQHDKICYHEGCQLTLTRYSCNLHRHSLVQPYQYHMPCGPPHCIHDTNPNPPNSKDQCHCLQCIISISLIRHSH